MRAAVFVRYHSGDGFGHVGWAFEIEDSVDAGSVENHSGHLFTPASEMGFWNGRFNNPVAEMRKRGYDDLKWAEVENADPLLAYRTVLWIEREAYKALHRNCEDDVYDVLRAYGLRNLAAPTLFWFPKSWFKRFRGTLEHLPEFGWPRPRYHGASIPAHDTAIKPWRPTWRRPWHPHFHALKLRGLAQFLRRR
ncbi:MAG TPA: hypothetical protein VFN37_02165 [Candidatus Baltobacteraceae bacterium]|nr:hypothetical protein [Candidatus Baltobacteraceae bacterium]